MTFYDKTGAVIPPPDFNREVAVYKNLANGWRYNLWSIVPITGGDGRGKPLICYADWLVMDKCRAVVNLAALARIQHKYYDEKIRAKEICAWIIGSVDPDPDMELELGPRVTFHPYDRDKEWFFTDNTEEPVWFADKMCFAPGGKAWLTAA